MMRLTSTLAAALLLAAPLAAAEPGPALRAEVVQLCWPRLTACMISGM